MYSRRNVGDLLVMTKDTDPDLRFMALNDLDKSIKNNSSIFSNTYLDEYTKVLIKGLNDDFDEVRTQALNCFKSVSYVLDLKVIEILKNLLNLNFKMLKKKKDSITSTIYTMAIHNILTNLPNSVNVRKNVNFIMLPNLVKHLNDNKNHKNENDDNDNEKFKIDDIEILVDLIENTSKVMNDQEIDEVFKLLIQCSFDEDGIISKKSIFVLPVMLKNIERQNVFESVFINPILNKFNDPSFKSDNLKMSVFILTLSSGIVGNPEMMYLYLDKLWAIVKYILNIEKINEVDSDYEIQQNSDLLKFECLALLTKIINNLKGDAISMLIPDILTIINLFISYDPYNSCTDEDQDLDNESNNSEYDDSEYDDYEQDEDADDDDDNYDSSWKLRSESLVLLTSIIKMYPIRLPSIIKPDLPLLIDRLKIEKNKDVIVKLINSLTLIFQYCEHEGPYYSLLTSKSIIDTTNGRRNSDISMQVDDDPIYILEECNLNICDSLLKFIDRNQEFLKEKVNLILKLIADLAIALNGLNEKYSNLFIVTLNDNWNTLIKNNETFNFYEALLTYCDLEELDDKGLNYLLSYITMCLSNEISNKFLMDALELLYLIFNKNICDNKSSEVVIIKMTDSVLDLLVGKIIDKNVSTEIRVQSLNVIVSIAKDVNLDSNQAQKVMQMFTEIISSEILALQSLNAISEIIESEKNNSFITVEWTKYILNSIYEYVFISDLSDSAIQIIKDFMVYNFLDSDDCHKLLYLIYKLQEDKLFKASNSNLFVIIITYILRNVAINSDLHRFLIALTELASYDKIDESLPMLITELLKQVDEENISKEILKCGNSTDYKISKCLAVLSVVSKDDTSINKVLKNLLEEKDIYFSLVFLDQVVKSIDLNVNLDIFLNNLESNHMNIVNISVKIISTMVSRYTSKYLDRFLNYINHVSDLKIDLNPSLKCLSIILGNIELNNDMAYNIFMLIIDIQAKNQDPVNKNKSFEVASECISILLIKYNLLESLLVYLTKSDSNINDNVMLTICNSVKFTFNDKLYLNEENLQDLVKYAEFTTNILFSNKLLIFKQVGISNLTLIINKKPNLAITLMNKILPNLMKSEIKPNKEYIHIQTIGPYKHKIDDGLIYRKQVFECIYYFLKVLEDNKNLQFLCSIKWELYFKQFFDAGVKDDQSIVSVCLLIVSKLFEYDPHIFLKESGTEDSNFTSFITRSRKILNKTMKENAVKQDVENYNNLIKLMVRFLKKTDTLIQSNCLMVEGTQLLEWNNLIKEVKSRFNYFEKEDI